MTSPSAGLLSLVLVTADSGAVGARKEPADRNDPGNLDAALPGEGRLLAVEQGASVGGV